MSPAPSSPVPKTRVEKVDNEPSYGQVPGTEAYGKREEDAMPDEIALPPAATSPGLDQGSPTSDASSESHTAPKTIVSESAGSTGPHSEEFKESIEEAHRKDATPDVVTHADDTAEGSEKGVPSPAESPEGSSGAADADTGMRVHAPTASPSLPLGAASLTLYCSPGTSTPSLPPPSGDVQDPEDEGEDEKEDEGDDFDEFEEGDEDEDFDDFEDGFQQAEPTTPISPHGAPQPAAAPQQPAISLPFVGHSCSCLRSTALIREPGGPRL